MKHSCFSGGQSGWGEALTAACLARSGSAHRVLHYIADDWFGKSLGYSASGVLSHRGAPLWEQNSSVTFPKCQAPVV